MGALIGVWGWAQPAIAVHVTIPNHIRMVKPPC
jgi:hypothetical protein